MPFESEAGLSSSAATPKRDKDESNSEWAKMSIGESREDGNPEDSAVARFATTASWIVNWFLLFAKIYCVIATSSKAVSASLADSAVDLVSQAVLSLADYYMSIHSPAYPVGRC